MNVGSIINDILRGPRRSIRGGEMGQKFDRFVLNWKYLFQDSEYSVTYLSALVVFAIFIIEALARRRGFMFYSSLLIASILASFNCYRAGVLDERFRTLFLVESTENEVYDESEEEN